MQRVFGDIGSTGSTSSALSRGLRSFKKQVDTRSEEAGPPVQGKRNGLFFVDGYLQYVGRSQIGNSQTCFGLRYLSPYIGHHILREAEPILE